MRETTQTGAIASLMHEYKNVFLNLFEVLEGIHDADLKTVVDTETKNPDGKSIQGVLTHILYWARNYNTMVELDREKESLWHRRKKYKSIEDYIRALKTVYEETVVIFEGISNKELQKRKITTSWGQVFDYEQLLEHAIVHVSRHRWQIEKFKTLL